MIALAAAIAFVLLNLPRRSPHGLVTVVFHLRPILALGAVPLGIWALVRGEYATSVLVAVGLAAWIRHSTVRSRQREGAGPAVAAADAPARALRLLSLNTGDHRSDDIRVLTYLGLSNADVICLQEVSESLFGALARELSGMYPHCVRQGTGLSGLAILSRFPIEWSRELDFGGRLAHLMAELDVRGRRLRVINAHPFARVALLDDTSPERADFLGLARVAAEGPPSIIAGDLNTTDESRCYALLERTGLVDAFRSVRSDLGHTFPLPFRYYGLPFPPLVRIDFHWHTGHLQALGSRVGGDASSDHLPLETEFAWRHAVLQGTPVEVAREPEPSRTQRAG